MKNKFVSVAVAAAVAAGAISTAPAFADQNHYDGHWRDGRYYYDNGSYYYHGHYYDRFGHRRGSRYYRGENVYRGRNYYYRHRCSGGNGAVGTVAGGVGGAVIGNALGGTAGTVLGGVGGALLGRHLDKENTRDRHGC